MSDQGWLQDDPPDREELMEVPRRPETDAEIAALPVLDLEEFVQRGQNAQKAVDEIIDAIGEHEFAAGSDRCEFCGCTMAEATARKACGRK